MPEPVSSTSKYRVWGKGEQASSVCPDSEGAGSRASESGDSESGDFSSEVANSRIFDSEDGCENGTEDAFRDRSENGSGLLFSISHSQSPPLTRRMTRPVWVNLMAFPKRLIKT